MERGQGAQIHVHHLEVKEQRTRRDDPRTGNKKLGGKREEGSQDERRGEGGGVRKQKRTWRQEREEKGTIEQVEMGETDPRGRGEGNLKNRKADTCERRML